MTTFTYADGVRDDRVQILTLAGEQVATIQDDGVEGTLAGPNGDSDLVAITSFSRHTGGTYVYDLASDQFVRISDDFGHYGTGGPAPGRARPVRDGDTR